MCDPVSIGLSVAGAGLSAISSISQTNAQNKANDYNAAIMQRNAQISQMQGEEAVKAGALEEGDYRKQIRKLMATQKAGYAAAGVDVNVGTPVDVMADTAQQGEVDALTIRRNAALKKWGFENEANNYIANANMLKASKKSALMAGATSFIGGLTPLASTYGQYKLFKGK